MNLLTQDTSRGRPCLRRRRLTPFSALLWLTATALIAVMLAGCSSGAKSGEPALPHGFIESGIPNVDLDAYFYVSAGREVGLPPEAFGDAGELAGQPLGVQSLEAVLNAATDEFGVAVDFTRVQDAELVHSSLELRDLAPSRQVRQNGSRFVQTQGGSAWANALLNAWLQDQRASLEDKYPEVNKLVRLLPQQAPGQPVVAGFVLNTSTLAEELLGKTDISTPGLNTVLEFIGVESAAFMVYADDLQELPAEPALADLPGLNARMIAVAETGYPGFLVGLVIRAFAGRAGLQTVDIEGESVLYRELSGSAHLMAKNYGPVMFFALAPTREGAQQLVESVIANQQ